MLVGEPDRRIVAVSPGRIVKRGSDGVVPVNRRGSVSISGGRLTSP